MTTQTPSLGELLRMKIERDEQERFYAAGREAAERAAIARLEHATVTDLFDNAKKRFEHAILSGTGIVPIRIGHGDNLEVERILQTFQRRQIDDQGHPYHAVWEDFAKWANSNGLEAQWRDDHDGMGISSWRLLTVVPQKS